VKSIAELTQAYDRMDPRAQASTLVQEYIPGGAAADWIFNGCFDRSSACLFRGTGLKLRQLPVGTGAATLGVSLPNAVVEDVSVSLVRAMHYTGMIDVDYRFDYRDGRYKLLDVNPRIGASFRLFVAEDGTDVLRAHYLDATGQPVTRTRARYGRKWIVELRDVRSCLKLLRSGQLNARAWLRSIAGVEEMAWFDSGDMAPFAAMLRHYASRYLHGRAVEIQ
jgi:D-aspartate ligase